MSAAAAIHVGDEGTVLAVAVVDEQGEPVDIGAAALSMFLAKPDGTVLTRTAALDADGADGVMAYTTAAGDLDAAGTWKVQGKVVVGGVTFRTAVGEFEVLPNLA